MHNHHLPEQSTDTRVIFLKDDMLRSLIDDSEVIIEQSTVGLVYSGELLASAVCVRINESYCLLTAGHIVALLIRLRRRGGSGFLQLVIESKVHCSQIRLDFLGLVVCPRYRYKRLQGPDLGVIELSALDLVTHQVRAKKTFISISAERYRPFESHLKTIRLVAGHPGQGVISSKASSHFGATWGAVAYCYPVQIVSVYAQQSTEDSWVVSPYWTHCKNPNYCGVSGGGLWSVELEGEAGRYEVKSVNLCGIVYLQGGFGENGVRDLMVMGPKSVYLGCSSWFSNVSQSQKYS